jgi:hypothetical protein
LSPAEAINWNAASAKTCTSPKYPRWAVTEEAEAGGLRSDLEQRHEQGRSDLLGRGPRAELAPGTSEVQLDRLLRDAERDGGLLGYAPARCQRQAVKGGSRRPGPEPMVKEVTCSSHECWGIACAQRWGPGLAGCGWPRSTAGPSSFALRGCRQTFLLVRDRAPHRPRGPAEPRALAPPIRTDRGRRHDLPRASRAGAGTSRRLKNARVGGSTPACGHQ